MISKRLLKGWIAGCSVTAVSLGAVGCASPRTHVQAARVVPPASSRSIALPQAQPTNSARRSTSAAPVSRSTSLGRSQPDIRSRPAAELERAVARYTQSPSQVFDPPAPIRDWQFIILHHSGKSEGGFASIDRFHREVKKWDECGYHFVIGNGSESGDGEIEVGGRWLKQKHGAHTKPPGHDEYNQEGIGICLVGNFNDGPPTPKQIEACRRLVAYLQGRCDVAPQNVIPHGSVEGTHTACPGNLFPLDLILPRSGFATR